MGKMKPRSFIRSGHVCRRWTDEEDRYILRHRTDGAEKLAAALDRTPGSVKVHASRDLHVSLAARPGDVCPRCATYEIREGTDAARHGLCPVCWEREKVKALEERTATLNAQRAYDRAKWHAKAARRGAANG